MGKKLYVGNLSFNIGKDELEQIFAAHGTVGSMQLITDRETGRSKGFAFVEMGTDQEAQAAIAALHGKEIHGRSITVNEARTQESDKGGKGHRGNGRRNPGTHGSGGFGRNRH